MCRLTLFLSFACLFGFFFFSSPVLANTSSYLSELQKKAQSGFPEAQYNLGVIYEDGQGVRQDYGLAARWYLRAAKQGLVYAQHNLGILYTKGKGVPRNYVEAYKWLSLSAALPGAKLLRDKVAKKLSPPEEVEAARRIREWKPVLER